MQRLQGWVRYAAQQLPAGASGGKSAGAQEDDGDDEAFIYGRVAVHSDDEEPGTDVDNSVWAVRRGGKGLSQRMGAHMGWGGSQPGLPVQHPVMEPYHLPISSQ